MAASNTPKKKTTTKKNSVKRKTSSGKAPAKTKGKQSISSGFQTEIILLVLMAAAIILMVSCMGLGGSVGGSISKVLMGIMGLMAYVFPIALFIAAAFLISNKGNVLAYKKTAAAAVLFFIICGLLQLFTEGYTDKTTLVEYYRMSSEYRTGGGILGGAICISTISAFGTVGAYVIIVLVILVCLILITQHSFLGFLYKLYDGLVEMVKGGHERYREGAPERQLKKELKAHQRQVAAEERRARRMQELEEALAEDESDIESPVKPKKKSGKLSKRKGKAELEMEAESISAPHSGHISSTAGKFLAGTDLFADYAGDSEENLLNPLKAAAPGKEDFETEEDKVGNSSVLDFPIHRGTSHSENEEKQEKGFNQSLEEEEFLKNSFQEEEPFYKKEQHDEMPEDLADEARYGNNEPHAYEKQNPYPEKDDQEERYSEEIYPEEVSSGPGLRAKASAKAASAGTAPSVSADSPAPEEKASRTPTRNPKSSRQEIENGIVNIQHEINTQEAAVKKEYQFPPVNLLKRGNGKSQGDSDAHLRKTAQKLQEILYNFGVNATVTNVSCGPTVTRYELQPEMGVKVSKIVGLSDDIKLNLAAPDIRIEAPIPGKAAVGIEVPNKENSPVMLRDLIQSPEFQNAKSKLAFAAGKDIEGKTVVSDIAKMPHLLIAGSTGSGKSVCINTLIISILYKAKPDEVKLIMIDPKVVELSVYNGIPHLFIPVVTDPKKAAGALNWAVNEMSNRYNTFAEYGVRNLEEFNKKIEHMKFPEGEQRPEKMCQIVIIVDELADLMMVAPGDVEDAICRLAQLARAAGIHLVIATQRPSVNVITGLIKANMPSRIAFAVTSGVDSRTILDMNGAEKLLGKGDMLFYPQGYQKPARLQGAFVSDEEVSEIVNFLADKNPGMSYNNKIEQQMNNAVLTAGSSGGDERDVYFEQAGKFIIEKEKASIGMLQRMYKIGFNRAARIMDQLCDAGVVGPEEGTKPRKVLMSMEEFQTYIEEH